MLNCFSVKAYRNLNIENMSLGRINVLVGPNNSGKSNFIDAISFISNLLIDEKSKSSTQETAFMSELDKRGWGEIFDRRKSRPGHVELTWELSKYDNTMPLSYNLKFQIPDTSSSPPEGYRIIQEKLQFAKPIEGLERPFNFISCHEKEQGKGEFSVKERNIVGKSKKRDLEVSDQDTVLNQLDNLLNNKMFYLDLYPNFSKTAKHVKDFFAKFRSYSSTKLNLELIRQPVKNNQERFLEPDGSNFLNVLLFLDSRYKFLEKYTERLRELIHKLDEIIIEKIEDKYLMLNIKIDGHWFKLSEMSDGTIKGMIMALLLWTPERYSLLSLDEPELNIHPAWLKILSYWITRSESADQIFVSSHSPDLLDGLTEDFRRRTLNLYAFNSSNNNNTLDQVLPERILNQLDEGWQLGDLYRIGEPLIGGWPW